MKKLGIARRRLISDMLEAEANTFIYPIPILNLGLVGFKQELSNNQVSARVSYKF
jgi:hypothetical protein